MSMNPIGQLLIILSVVAVMAVLGRHKPVRARWRDAFFTSLIIVTLTSLIGAYLGRPDLRISTFVCGTAWLAVWGFLWPLAWGDLDEEALLTEHKEVAE